MKRLLFMLTGGLCLIYVSIIVAGLMEPSLTPRWKMAVPFYTFGATMIAIVPAVMLSMTIRELTKKSLRWKRILVPLMVSTANVLIIGFFIFASFIGELFPSTYVKTITLSNDRGAIHVYDSSFLDQEARVQYSEAGAIRVKDSVTLVWNAERVEVVESEDGILIQELSSPYMTIELQDDTLVTKSHE